MDEKDKLIEILKATIEDYRKLVVKYKESEGIYDKIIYNLNEQIVNQLKMINLLSDAIR